MLLDDFALRDENIYADAILHSSSLRHFSMAKAFYRTLPYSGSLCSLLWLGAPILKLSELHWHEAHFGHPFLLVCLLAPRLAFLALCTPLYGARLKGHRFTSLTSIWQTRVVGHLPTALSGTCSLANLCYTEKHILSSMLSHLSPFMLRVVQGMRASCNRHRNTSKEQPSWELALWGQLSDRLTSEIYHLMVWKEPRRVTVYLTYSALYPIFRDFSLTLTKGDPISTYLSIYLLFSSYPLRFSCHTFSFAFIFLSSQASFKSNLTRVKKVQEIVDPSSLLSPMNGVLTKSLHRLRDR